MGEKKVTIMILKVDLQCEKCYRKVKKVLCKFPQIRDQTYDEKNNLVIIKVVCCSPEKIRDKLCCKGGGVIKSIEIKEPEKGGAGAGTGAGKGAGAGTAAGKGAGAGTGAGGGAGAGTGAGGGAGAGTGAGGGAGAGTGAGATPCAVPMPGRACCIECYGGHPGGPCETGYGGYGGAALFIQYYGYYGRPVYDSYCGGRSYATGSCCVTRPDCFSEENPHACAIM